MEVGLSGTDYIGIWCMLSAVSWIGIDDVVLIAGLLGQMSLSFFFVELRWNRVAESKYYWIGRLASGRMTTHGVRKDIDV